MTARCAELVHEHTICIYLRTSLEELVERLSSKEESESRPMLSTGSTGKAADSPVVALRGRITELMALRSSTYEGTAHYIVDTDGKGIDEIAAEIVGLLG